MGIGEKANESTPAILGDSHPVTFTGQMLS
jgi:hypothetical protein